MTLYHFTCSHSHDRIGTSGLILPMTGYAWFTDLANPPREAVGLTSNILLCDRMEYRYAVTDAADIRPWLAVRREVPPAYRDALEAAPGAMPRHWYVSSWAVPVVLVGPVRVP